MDDEWDGEDEDQTEEDKEVQKLMEKEKTMKRKIRTGRYTIVTVCQNCQKNVIYMYCNKTVCMLKWSKQCTLYLFQL